MARHFEEVAGLCVGRHPLQGKFSRSAQLDTDAVVAFGNGAAEPDLAQLVEVLGPSVLRVLATPGLKGVPVRQVVVYDVGEPPTLRRGDVLLGVGLIATSDDACRVAKAAGRAGVAALAVRSGEADLPQLRTTALESNVTLLALPAAMQWEHISVLIRHAIMAPPPGSSSEMATGDLFGFANVLAATVGGSVTVEDAQSRVLAYSTLDVNELDAPRREAILGRQVPETYLRHLEASGIFKSLGATDDAIEVEANEGLGLRRRLVVAVRAGGELLGSLWVQEGQVPFRPEAQRALTEAARLAPAHLIRAQSTGLTLRQHREDLLADLLEGRGDTAAAIDALGFDATLPCAVIAVAFKAAGQTDCDRNAVRRLSDLLSARAMAFRWLVATVFSGGRLLILVPELTGPASRAEAGVERLARSLAADARQVGLSVRVACGPLAKRLADVPHATRKVDQTLQLLADEPAYGPVATYGRVRAAVAVGAILDALAGLDSLREGPIARLLDHDRRYGTAYCQTLRTWLDNLGDNARAARLLNIHPNTIRYRLQRLVEVSGMQLDDPDERLVALLHLRHVQRTGAPTVADACWHPRSGPDSSA